MTHQIKKIKEFIQDGPPQFEVLDYAKAGESITVDIYSYDTGMSFRETIEPVNQYGSLIKKVKRINDKQIFKINSLVTANGDSAFIVQFLDDLIHCSVVIAYGKEPETRQIPINDVVFEETVADAEAEFDEQ